MQELFLIVLFACLAVLCVAATVFICMLIAALIKEYLI